MSLSYTRSKCREIFNFRIFLIISKPPYNVKFVMLKINKNYLNKNDRSVAISYIEITTHQLYYRRILNQLNFLVQLF